MLRTVLHMFVKYLMASAPRFLRCLMFMPSGSMKLLFVLLEMANCTCAVISRILLVGRFLTVWFYVSVYFISAGWNDVCDLFIKSFYFIYVNDGCFSSETDAFFV